MVDILANRNCSATAVRGRRISCYVVAHSSCTALPLGQPTRFAMRSWWQPHPIPLSWILDGVSCRRSKRASCFRLILLTRRWIYGVRLAAVSACLMLGFNRDSPSGGAGASSTFFTTDGRSSRRQSMSSGWLKSAVLTHIARTTDASRSPSFDRGRLIPLSHVLVLDQCI